MDKLPFTPEYLLEVIGTFYGELVYLNRLSSLTNCAIDSRDTVTGFTDLFKKITEGAGMDEMMDDGISIGYSIIKALNDCDGAAFADLQALNQWFVSRAGSKQAMVDAASANSRLHSQEIQQHVMEVWDVFFKFNEPRKTGIALGQVAYWALGPVDKLNALL